MWHARCFFEGMTLRRACALMVVMLVGCASPNDDTIAAGENLTSSSTACTINSAPAASYYGALVHTAANWGSPGDTLVMNRELTLTGQLSTKLGEKLLRLDLFLLKDGTYIGGYSEGRLLSRDSGGERSLVEAAVVLKGTWKVECEKIRLSDLGLAEPFAFEYIDNDNVAKEQPGIRVTMDRDLVSPGLKGTQRVLLRTWSSTGPADVVRDFTLVQ